MAQTLHIFRKDVWHLRFEIAIALLLNAVFLVNQIRDAHHWGFESNQLHAADGFTLLLSLAWGFMLTRAVHAEALAGDRQFWLTRPYSRRSLLVSKILFAIVFVNLPILICDIAIISANGFAASRFVGEFL